MPVRVHWAKGYSRVLAVGAGGRRLWTRGYSSGTCAQLVSGGSDWQVKLWVAKTGQLLSQVSVPLLFIAHNRRCYL